ncbi:hypothetical protein C4566_03240 [Candidatus Parcubacteria bacterium]|nr:MAG: hypothetical protein C4566_03240 [Candidatus Parcubacteria bacterium]
MDNIEIKEQKVKAGKYLFVVEVGTTDKTIHKVTLDRDYWQYLSDKKITPGQLILTSFMFLLNHESKESILKEFDLKDINRYFPEYEEFIRK